MENIILSMLLIESKTVYEIRALIQKALSDVCSDSLGSIQTAIKKLLEKCCITVYEFQENGKAKKRYSITEKGVEQFNKWINTPMNIEKVKNMEEGKFFFLGMASKETRIKSLQAYVDSLKSEKSKLNQIQKYLENSEKEIVSSNLKSISKQANMSGILLEISGEVSLEQTAKNIYEYHLHYLHYGLRSIQNDIDFYSDILEKEQKNICKN